MFYCFLFILLLKKYSSKKDVTLQNKFIFFIIVFLFSLPVKAHTFTGMIGFYDGLSHPVLGIDHFLAMVSVGVISALIGNRAIWILPAIFVCFMIIGGIIGIGAEISKVLDNKAVSLSEVELNNYLADYIYTTIEFGIIFSVIFLGMAIALKQNFSVKITMVLVGFFGFCHGAAHGLEMPWAANPILFASGFATSTACLHLFGVGIGHYGIKSKTSYLLLRLVGLFSAVYGVYLIIITQI